MYNVDLNGDNKTEEPFNTENTRDIDTTQNVEKDYTIPDPPTTVVPVGRKKPGMPLLIASTLSVVVVAAGITLFLTGKFKPTTAKQVTGTNNCAAAICTVDQKTSQTTEQSELKYSTTATTLDTTKTYGNKYSSGLLPVGDIRYQTTGAKKGTVYSCRSYTSSGNGAGSRGPWFVTNNTQWDYNKKYKVKGSVNWKQEMNVTIKDGKRVISTNALPAHITGTYPIAKSDPVYPYDGNPSSISAQSLTYTLAANPTASTPQCMGGEVGIMLTGIPIFSGFDADGRDAGAWEAQDSCDGHPQNKGQYHYHTLSRCITDQSVATVIGYALDGFPITGPKLSEGNMLTTDDLDECHGITSEIIIDNKKVNSYHYVMTQDFPYSVSCFRATATKPPGQQGIDGGPGAGTPPPATKPPGPGAPNVLP